MAGGYLLAEGHGNIDGDVLGRNDLSLGNGIADKGLVDQLYIGIAFDYAAVLLVSVHTGQRRPERVGLKQKLRGKLRYDPLDIRQLRFGVIYLKAQFFFALGKAACDRHSLFEGVSEGLVAAGYDML